MKSCSVLSLNIVLCWRHLSILLGHSVLESSYSQKDSEVIGKALLSARELQDPALSPPLISRSFALDTNRGQATLSDCNLCLPSDGSGSRSGTGSWTWLKGRSWSSCLLPWVLPSPSSSVSGARSCLSPARLQVCSSIHTSYLGHSPKQQAGSLP